MLLRLPRLPRQTLKELLAVQVRYGFNPGHLGVLYALDRCAWGRVFCKHRGACVPTRACMHACMQPLLCMPRCHTGTYARGCELPLRCCPAWLRRDRDGRISLDELLSFAASMHAQCRRAARRHDAAYHAAGTASLRMWGDVREEAGRRAFVDWCAWRARPRAAAVEAVRAAGTRSSACR